MSLVHCERCGLLYDDGDTVGTVSEISFPSGKGWIGGICSKCFGHGDPNPTRSWKKMWYIDWISARRAEQEKGDMR